MQRLSAHDQKRLAKISREIGGLFDELDRLHDQFASDIQEVIEKLNELKEDAREIMDDAALEAESYFDERSDKWQEGERGERYAEWRDRLREVADAIAEDIDPPEVQMPDRPDWLGELEDQDFAELVD